MGLVADEPAEPASFTVNENPSVYYSGIYWNDHVEVRDWLNLKISGDPDRYWGLHTRDTLGRVFERGLVLNCGNGHVERGLLSEGLVKKAVGVDYSVELLEQARLEADGHDSAVRYVHLDTNTADFPKDEFDLVVNHAAAHHIAYIDRVFRELCRRLPEDGRFVSFDYVGPHRNQYGWEAWSAADALNRSLPERFRQDMVYPHLPTMLLHDPTEAIHSELIIETMHRYFHVDTFVPLGGAIAYPLLTHNSKVRAEDDDSERLEVIHRILAADDEFTASDPDRTLFAYILARPDKAALADDDQLTAWTLEEDDREARARISGGEYYQRSTLQTLTIRIEDERVDALLATERAEDLQTKLEALQSGYSDLQDRTAELQAQCDSLQMHYDDLHKTYDRIMSLPPYQQLRWLARTEIGEKLRRHPRVAWLTRPTRADHDGTA